jgi:predicted signal transduction protein with EAL and GGDEF domain
MLVQASQRIARVLRDGDVVARLGGDEFAILSRNLLGSEAAASIGLRVLECLVAPVVVDGVRHQVGASIGVALSPQDGHGAEELLRKADVALYRAKAEGRSGMRFFELAMDQRLRERDALEQALVADLHTEAFQVRFQPVATVDGAGVTRFEALPRWRRDGQDELEPDRFTPIAEEAGVLAELTEDMLARSCRIAAVWPPHVRLAFNLPSPLVRDTTFGLRIQSVLAETGFPPNRLAIEIDEGALIREPDAAAALIAPLRQAGISIVADHFGTGYSDLRKLQRLQIDGVKIDRTFVGAMTRDRKAAVMVKALIGVGLGLDLSVIADGVHTEEQRSALAAEGCLSAQGALYGGALEPEQTLALFETEPRRRRSLTS